MTVSSPEAAPAAAAAKTEERRALGVGCGAHALHDGYVDIMVIMLPLLGCVAVFRHRRRSEGISPAAPARRR